MKVVNRFSLNGTIDGHDPVGATFRFGPGEFLTVITVNLGRTYTSTEHFERNLERLFKRVKRLNHPWALFIQELDEDDKADEKAIFKRMMPEGTSLVGWDTHEPIAVSPGVRVTRERKVMTMDQGTAIGAPTGTGPRRYLVSCIIHVFGRKIGLGNQHPHRNLSLRVVQEARRRGESVTRLLVKALLARCEAVIHGGDMNDRDYPKSHPNEKLANERDLDTIRYVEAA